MIDLVPYGKAAREALAEQVAAAKREDPLAPVTVIVPSNYAGLSVRRALAATTPIVNVHFMVAARLAELLGAPALSAKGKRPLTPWIRLQAVRAALRERPGVFAEVAGHPSTTRELQRVFAELRETSDASRERIARTSRRAADVIRLFDRFRRLSAGFFDEIDLMDAATDNLVSNPGAAWETGALVLYLPRKLAPALERLLRAVGTERVHAVLGLTGDSAVDMVTEALAARLPSGGAIRRMPVQLPQAARIVSATDPEEEVREAMRQAMAMTAEGVPLHRIAITFESRETYAGLLDDALTSAEIPHNGPPNQTLAQTVPGRTLLGLPKIAASSGSGDPGYAREVVMDWLTSAPIFDGASEAPSHRWDEISRDAGIVKGPEQWTSRLELHAASVEQRARMFAREGEESASKDAEWARSLKDFVSRLQAELGSDERARSGAHARKALGWLDAYLPERGIDQESQLEAREQVKRLLEAIEAGSAGLDPELDPVIGRGEFAAALEELLGAPFGRVGKLGDGIFTGPMTLAAEMEFDAVMVLGMVEGVLPSASRDDPILTTEERNVAGGQLPPGGRLPTDQRRAYLATLLSGETRILSHPRGDLRAQRSTQPSRWLLRAATELSGEEIYATELESRLTNPPNWFRVVHSFESALRNGEARASLQEWDLASLILHRGRLDRHFLLQRAGGWNALAEGVIAKRSRLRQGDGRLDDWSGHVPAGLAPVPGAQKPISPTALETFAKCPFRYFLGHVLHVGEVERPEDVITIEPAVIGQIVHEILQRFFEATAERPDPVADWSEEERGQLRAITRACFDDAERRGVTGKTLTWRAEQARLLRDLDLLLEEEIGERRMNQFHFKQAEAAFGMDATPARPVVGPPAQLTLASGEVVSFRGLADRVDVGPNGELAIVDYKTGSTRSYKELTGDNVFAGGKFLQLPVYALAFKDQSQAPVRASYWFITESASFERKTMVLDEKTYEAFGGIVSTLVETMRSGFFPAVPGEDDWRSTGVSWANCRYCPYDSVCPSANRIENWNAVKNDPGLRNFAGLASGDIPGDDDA
ncbi:MAG: PD-(D/E)XK nuclease family protein [Dehalococcoidia bacterium]